MKKNVFFIVLIVAFILQSCSINGNSHEDIYVRIENSMVDNVYKHIKMDCFHGFLDRQTVSDLIKYHGKPDSIYDAYESTTIENYDIYEYRFDDGAINCYVPQNGNGIKYVDYIYFEPKRDLNLSEVVTDEELIKQIKDSGANDYYVVDQMRVFVKIHFDPRDKSKVGNISLNDVSLLEERTPLSNFVSDIKKHLPLEYGSLGNLISVNKEKDTLKFAWHQDYVEQNLFLENIEKSPNIEKSLAIFLFGPSGNLNAIAKDIMEEHCNVAFDIKIGSTEISKHYAMSHEALSKLFYDGITSHDILVSYININNLCGQSVMDDNQGETMEIGGIYLSDSTLVYPFIFKSGNERILKAWGKNILKVLTNVENPDRMIVYHAARDNKGLTIDFQHEKNHDHNQVTFTREETIKLYHSIVSQP